MLKGSALHNIWDEHLLMNYWCSNIHYYWWAHSYNSNNYPDNPAPRYSAQYIYDTLTGMNRLVGCQIITPPGCQNQVHSLNRKPFLILTLYNALYSALKYWTSWTTLLETSMVTFYSTEVRVPCNYRCLTKTNNPSILLGKMAAGKGVITRVVSRDIIMGPSS